ncbi:LORF1 protein, partial [Crocuta crocuta]
MTKRKSSPPKKLLEELTANELLKTDISSINEQDFRLIIIKLIAGPEKNIRDIKKTMAIDKMETINRHEEFKKAINEIHNKLEASNARIEEAERRIGDLEDTMIEKQEADKKRDKLIQEQERRVRELSDMVKRNNICIIGIPEEDERGKGAEGVLGQIIAKNFPDLGKEVNVEIQEAQRTPLRRNLNRPSA